MTTRFDFFVYSKKETSCFFITNVNAVIFIEALSPSQNDKTPNI